MRISQSEISNFLQCRRQWDLTSQVRRSLARVGPPNANLHVGTLVHAGLELHLNGIPEDDFWQAWGEEIERINAPILEAHANAPRIGESTIEAELNAMGREAGKTLQRFFNQYGYEAPYGDNLTPIGVEFQFNVPVPNLHNVHFQGTFDAIMLDKSRGKIVIIEHKTFAKKPDLELKRMEPQFVLYAWAARKLFHRDVEVLYNGCHKKTGNACVRATFTFDEAELNAAGEFLVAVATDMQEATGRNALYPNRHWMECNRCGVRDICDEMQRGRDPERLIASKYRKVPPRSTFDESNAADTDAVDVLMKIIEMT